jgi:DedD protein
MLLAVIFIPMVLDNSAQQETGITETNIPPAPDIDFRSEVVPVEELAVVEPPPLPLETLPSSSTALETGSPASTDGQVPLSANDDSGATTPPASAVSPPAVPETEPMAAVDAQKSTATENATNPEQQSDSAQDSAQADVATRSMSAWVVQLGSFSSRENADSLVRRLQTNGFPGYVEQVKSGTESVFKVRVGPELSRAKAETIQKNLKTRLNLDAIILRFP